MKQHPQIDGSVAKTTTYSQQSSVCSTVSNAPPCYQAIPHLLTPSPACYSYPNAPNCQTNLCDQLQSVIPVSYNMHVPPPSNISVVQSTSLGIAPPSNIPIAQSPSQGMVQAGGYQNQDSVRRSSVNQGSVNLSSESQSSVNQHPGSEGSRNQGSSNQGFGN